MTETHERGLYGKYRVERVDGKEIGPRGCIVLEVDDDRTHAALAVWAERVERDGFSALAGDVWAALRDAAGWSPTDEQMMCRAVANLAATLEVADTLRNIRAQLESTRGDGR